MLHTSLIAALLSVAPLMTAFQSGTQTGKAQLSEQERKEGFVLLFNGKNLEGWQGSVDGYLVQDGKIICKTKGGGNLLTQKEFSDFILRFEYKLPPGGNNGVGIRAPAKGNPAYDAMEIQILDDSAPRYQHLKPEQYNGSIYGAVAAKRGHLKPVGQWNSMQIKAQGTQITITLNGAVIVDADTSKIEPKAIHGHSLRGLTRPRGHVGFLGHGAPVEFRNIRIKELK